MPHAPAFVVVGASLAGATAAATLREEGFDGRIVLIGEEPLPPYERPALSKGYLRGEEPLDALFVREQGWWEANDVEARFGERVRRVEPIERTVTLGDGRSIAFEKVLIATGVRNRRLAVPGAGLDGIYSLRTSVDADVIRVEAAAASHAVVVGMGPTGAEVTASLRGMGVAVTVVEVFATALYRILGPAIGRTIEAVHRDRGVGFVFEDTVERFEGRDRVERVITRAGRSIECDLVIVAIGTEPNAEVLNGFTFDPNGGIPVDATLRTVAPDVFAAGDIASHDHPRFGKVRVEHYDNALKMGRHAAIGMLGDVRAFTDPHWFWSDQYEHQLQMSGVAAVGEMVVRGSFEDRRFCAFFLDDAGVLRSAVSLDWPRDVRRSLPLIEAGIAPDRAALRDPAVDLRTLAV